jgi:hypothetical protein
LQSTGGCFHCRLSPSDTTWKPHLAHDCPGDIKHGIPPCVTHLSQHNTTLASQVSELLWLHSMSPMMLSCLPVFSKVTLIVIIPMMIIVMVINMFFDVMFHFELPMLNFCPMDPPTFHTPVVISASPVCVFLGLLIH